MTDSNMLSMGDFLELRHPTAEASVLAGMYKSAEVAGEMVKTLEPEFFSSELNSIAFESLRRLFYGIEPIDKQSLLAEMRTVAKERKSKLIITVDMLDFPGDPMRAVKYGVTVARYAWLRQASEHAHWMIKELGSNPDPDELFTAAQERWNVLAPKTAIADGFVYGWDTVNDYEQSLRQRAKDNLDPTKYRYLWPWADWTRRIRYLRPGMVGTLAAADGMGKSAYLEMIAEHWAMLGIPTVLVHLEDNLEYKQDRRMARHAQMTIDALEDSEDLTPEQWASIKEASGRIRDWVGNLHYLHAPGKSMHEILNKLEEKHNEGVCFAVVFDYLDKCQPTKAQIKAYGSNVWERQANDMEQLKTFAERLRIPVMTATQGNKDMQGEGTKTRKAIQGSGQKSQKSQLVIILTRELVEDAKGLKDEDGNLIAKKGEYSPIVNVRVDKQNRGAQLEFEQLYAGRFFTIRDLAR